MSEITPGDPGTKACAMARTTVFPFPPPDGKGGGVTLGLVEDCPPIDGGSFLYQGPVMTLHLSRPASIRQQREDVSHEWTFTRRG